MLGVLRQRNVVLLLGAGLVSTLGDFLLGIALPFYVYEQTGSALAMGALAAAGAVPRLLLGSVAGVFVDRWDRRRTMIAADLTRALLLLLLLAVSGADRVWLVYAVAFCQAAIGVFFEPARSALLPRAIPEEDLPAANALSATSRTAARLAGPVAGGALLVLFGLPSVVVVDCLSFVVSAALVALLAIPTSQAASRAMSPATPTRERASRAADSTDVAAEAARRWAAVWRDWLEGLRRIARSRVLAAVFVVQAAGMVAEGVINVAWIPFVKDALRGGAQEVGWLSSAFGFGAVAGGLLVAQHARRAPPVLLVALGTSAVGVLWLAMVNAPLLPVALVVMVLNGLVAAARDVGVETLLQRGADDAFRGRVFGAQVTTNAVARLAGIAAAGTLGDVAGITWTLNAASGLFVLAGAAAFALLPGARRGKTQERAPAPAA